MNEYWRISIFVNKSTGAISKSGIELRPVAHYFGILARKEIPSAGSGKARYLYMAMFPLLDNEVPDELGVLNRESEVSSVHLIAAEFEAKWQEVFGTDQVVQLELSRLS
ncbi:MAG: hypothetical protein ACSHX5_02820 [Phycisphaerales bacterium]